MNTVKLEIPISDKMLSHVLAYAGDIVSWADVNVEELIEDEHKHLSVTKISVAESEEQSIILDRAKILEAFRRILQNDFTSQESYAQLHVVARASIFEAITVVEGGDPDYIDLEAVDWIVQVACFGHMVYG